MLKKIILGMAGLIVIVLMGVFLLSSNIDSIIKKAVETYGSEATLAKTSLARVDISPTDGTGTLEGFLLGNPEGFATDSAIKIGKAFVKINTKSLVGKGPIIIDEVLIEGPEITYEVASATGSNLQTIQNNVAAYVRALAGGSVKTEKTEAEKKTEAKKPSRPLLIKSFILRDGKVNLSHELLEGKDLISAKLPLIRLTNIGNSQNGTTPVKIVQIILDRVTSAAISVGQANLVRQLREQGLESLKKSAEESEIGKGVTKAIDGIFGK